MHLNINETLLGTDSFYEDYQTLNKQTGNINRNINQKRALLMIFRDLTQPSVNLIV